MLGPPRPPPPPGCTRSGARGSGGAGTHHVCGRVGGPPHRQCTGSGTWSCISTRTPTHPRGCIGTGIEDLQRICPPLPPEGRGSFGIPPGGCLSSSIPSGTSAPAPGGLWQLGNLGRPQASLAPAPWVLRDPLESVGLSDLGPQQPLALGPWGHWCQDLGVHQLQDPRDYQLGVISFRTLGSTSSGTLGSTILGILGTSGWGTWGDHFWDLRVPQLPDLGLCVISSSLAPQLCPMPESPDLRWNPTDRKSVV